MSDNRINLIVITFITLLSVLAMYHVGYMNELMSQEQVSSDNIVESHANVGNQAMESSSEIKTARSYVNLLDTMNEYESAAAYVGYIRTGVEQGTFTWDQIGTNDTELNQKLKDVRVREAEDNLKIVKSAPSYDTIVDCDQVITGAVTEGVISWEGLNTTPEQYKEMVDRNKKQRLEKCLEDLKTNSRDIDAQNRAERDRKEICQAVDDKFITLSDLKTTQEEIDYLHKKKCEGAEKTV